MFLYLLTFLALVLFLGLSGAMIILGVLSLTNAGLSTPKRSQQLAGLLSLSIGLLGFYLIFSSVTVTIN